MWAFQQQSHGTLLDIILYQIMCYAYLLGKHICELRGERVERPGFIPASRSSGDLLAQGCLMPTASLFQTLGQRRQWTIVNLPRFADGMQFWCASGLTLTDSPKIPAGQDLSARKHRGIGVKTLFLTTFNDDLRYFLPVWSFQ